MSGNSELLPVARVVDHGGAARCGVVLDLADGAPLGVLLPPATVAQLMRSARVSPVPNAPAWFAGIVNRRGHLVPVFDLAHYFELAPPAQRNHVVVVGDGATAFALPVTREPRILPPDIAAGSGADAPAVLAPFLTAMYRHDGIGWCDFRFDAWLARLAAGASPEPLHSTSASEKPA